MDENLKETKLKKSKTRKSDTEKKAHDVFLPQISQRKLDPRTLSPLDKIGQKIIERLNETVSSPKIFPGYNNQNTLINKSNDQLSILSKLPKNETNFSLESTLQCISPQITGHKKLESLNERDLQSPFFENAIKAASMQSLFSETKVSLFNAHKEKIRQPAQLPQHGDSSREDLNSPKINLYPKINIESKKNLQLESKSINSDSNVELKSSNLKFRGALNKKEFNINIPKRPMTRMIDHSLVQNRLPEKLGINSNRKLNKSPITKEKNVRFSLDDDNKSDPEYFMSHRFNNQIQDDKSNLNISNQSFSIEDNIRHNTNIDMAKTLQLSP